MGKGFWFSGAGCKSEQLIGGCAEDLNSSKVRKFFNKKVAIFSVFLLMIICASAVFAAGRCVPCRANHYCQGGVPIMCPADKPVTNGTGGVTEADCMSCTTRNGAGNPFFGGYNLGVGNECISCVEDNADTPFWNGSACVSCATANAGTPVWNGSSCEACPENTAWDGTTCAENVVSDVECAFTIPHDGGTLCLVDGAVPWSTYKSFSPCLYGLTDCQGLENNWLGANLYCESLGLRLPTMEELELIAKTIYVPTSSCDIDCWTTGSNCCVYDVTLNNQELYDFIAENAAKLDYLEGEYEGYFGLWSSNEYPPDDGYRWDFAPNFTVPWGNSPKEGGWNALCIK